MKYSVQSFNTRLMTQVQAIDLTNVRNRLVVHHGFGLEAADHAIVNYQKFLYLCGAYPDVTMSPTEEVDLVWHDHILHLEQYLSDCESVFGRIIFHRPHTTSLDELAKPKTPEHNPAFLELSELVFGTLPLPFGVSDVVLQTCDKCTYVERPQDPVVIATCDKCTNAV